MARQVKTDYASPYYKHREHRSKRGRINDGGEGKKVRRKQRADELRSERRLFKYKKKYLFGE